MRYEVGALRKSALMLRVLADSEDALGVSELARRAGIAKNMAYRILMTLAELGWVQQEGEGGGFRLTLVPFRLFARPLERATLTTACHQPLRWLGRETGETAYVSVLDGLRAVNVQVIEGGRDIRVSGRVGSAFDLHCTAQGKVLLAAGGDDLLRRVEAAGLTRRTRATITTGKRLAQHLERVRQDGFAINDEEFAPGLVGCAAPIIDTRRAVVAAIGVFATTIAVDVERMRRQLAPLVRKAAEWTSLNLGAPGSDAVRP
ncbi:MAG TPA: IclR family transcriptional regulator [Planctomycetota bacterium]|nr:IclR family transcriptional regulator [Planctomycetota bacterium]